VMGKHKNTLSTKVLLYGLGGIVTVLNVALFISFFR
jgi:manganese transport protein